MEKRPTAAENRRFRTVPDCLARDPEAGQCKLVGLLSGVDRLEDLMRGYCARSSTCGAHNLLAEDIRQAALEASPRPNWRSTCS